MAKRKLQEQERNVMSAVFDEMEIKYIFRQRKEYDSKNIRKLMTSKSQRLRYVRLKMEIMELEFYRINLLKDNCMKFEMRKDVVDRIRSFFILVKCHFQNDYRPWLWYINFCKTLKLHDCVEQMLEALVCMHGDNPKIWKLAARWEFYEKGSVHTARQFLLRGIRFLPHSTEMYKEAFRLELEYADYLCEIMKDNEYLGSNPQKNNIKDVALDFLEKRRRFVATGGLAEVVYEIAFAKLSDVELIIQLLKISRGYKFTTALQLKIIRNMCSKFSENARTWDTVARNELSGLRCFPKRLEDATFPPNHPRNTEFYTLNLKERILRSTAVYSYAVRRLKTKEMWSLYLDMLMKLNRNDKSNRWLPKLKSALLFKGFMDAYNSGLIEEKYYLYWVRFAAASRNKLLGYVLRISSQKLKHNVSLWQLRLEYCLTKGIEQEAVSAFKDALINMQKETCSLLYLWTTVLVQKADANPIVEKLFIEGIKPNSSLSWHLKPMYLEWLAKTKDINASRDVYEKLYSENPIFVQFHYSMAELELSQINVDIERVRRCYENACEQFGKSLPDVWVQYIKIELMRGDLDSTYEILNRALEVLNPQDVDEFVSKYSILRSSITFTQNILSVNA